METGRSSGVDALLLKRIAQATDTWLQFLLGESNEMHPYAMGAAATETADFRSLEQEVVALRNRLETLSQDLLALRTRGTVTVPILGRIPAGALQEAVEHAEDVVALPRWWVRHAEKVFLLRVVGDSMSPTLEAGDLAIVMPGPTARD
ncbi:MAG: LexA family protein, partial [Candidatus Xenobia bacterium]